MDKRPYMDRLRGREEKIKNSDRLDPKRDYGPDKEGRYSIAMYPEISSSEEDASRQVGARLKGGITRNTREPANPELGADFADFEEGGFRKGGSVSMKGGGSVRGAGVAQRGQGKMRMF